MKIEHQSVKLLSKDYELKQGLLDVAYAAGISRGRYGYSQQLDLGIIRRLIKRGHDSVLEFGDMKVEVLTNRAIANALTRHRHISVIQESTRYCKYDTLSYCIHPADEHLLKDQLNELEIFWNGLNLKQETKRLFLPSYLSARLMIKTNFREWRHIIKIRSTKENSPMMRDLAFRFNALLPKEVCFEESELMEDKND